LTDSEAGFVFSSDEKEHSIYPTIFTRIHRKFGYLPASNG